MKNSIFAIVLFMGSISVFPSACAQIDEDVTIVEEYSLIHDDFDDIITAWNTLLEHKALLESQGYTLMPKCFTHSRFKWINSETGTVSTKLRFVTKRIKPEGCANVGTFSLTKHEGGDDWECKLSISREEPLRDCHLGRE